MLVAIEGEFFSVAYSFVRALGDGDMFFIGSCFLVDMFLVADVSCGCGSEPMVGLSRVVFEDRAASFKGGLIHTSMRGRGGRAGVDGGMVSSGGLIVYIFNSLHHRVCLHANLVT